MWDVDEIKKSLKDLENPFSTDGARHLLKKNPYDNIFEKGEIREFISPSDTDSSYLTPWDNPFETEKIQEKKADRQPWAHKVGAGLSRVGLKVGSEIAKMPGVLGGLVYGLSDTDNYMELAFNNAWIRSVSDVEESIKEDILPVYVKKAVREGNLWDNITSVDFWATEGADGLGYIISMLAPGQVINKFGVGSKLLGVNKFSEMAAKTKYADDIIKRLDKVGYTAKNADLATSTFANTLFEAGAEAKSAMDSYIGELERRRLLAPTDPGYLTQEEYEKELQKKGDVGRNVFLANAAILVGPNAIMSKMLWGKARNKAVGDIASGNRLQPIANPSLKIKAGRVGKDILYAGAREGLWEEGMQSTAEQYFTDNPNARFTDIIGDLPKAYIDMFSETEGQKAMFLGAVFGGGMQGYFGAKSRKSERENTNKLIETGNNILGDIYNVFNEDIYQKDENGNVIFTEVIENHEVKQQPKVDLEKLERKLNGANQLEYLSGLYDVAVEQGDVEKVEAIKESVTTHLIKPFIINEELGLDVLKQHLEKSSELVKVTEREKIDHKKFIDSIMEKANSLQEEYNTFQDFAPSVIKLDNKNATVNEKVDFYNKLANQYVDNKSRELYINKKLSKKEEQFNNLLNQRGIDPSSIEDNKWKVRDLGIIDSRITKLNEEIQNLKEDLKQVKSISNSFWDNKTASEAFNKQVNNRIKREKYAAQIEEDTNNTIELINSAESLDELDNINIPDNVPSEVLEQYINDKRKEIQDKNDIQAKQASEENEQYNQQSNAEKIANEESLEYIKNNFNVGETVTVPNVMDVPEEYRGISAEITDIKDTQINFKTEEGKAFAFKLTTFSNLFNTDDANYVTEGSEDNIQEEVKDFSGKKYEERNQPRIIITDNNKGEKLSFISDGALEFERTPRDKKGEEKSIQVNNDIFSNYQEFEKGDFNKLLTLVEQTKKGENTNTPENLQLLQNYPKLFEDLISNKTSLSEKQQKALDTFNNNDFSDITLLIDHLPLNIVLSEGITAPLETKSETSKMYNDTFNKTSRDLRRTIIKELQKGTNIEDIKVPIAGQWRGTLQLEESVIENPITGLYEIANNIKNVKSENIYFVNDFGLLVNKDEDILPTRRRLAKGEVYLKIKTANGENFPLKLNIKKISEEQAGILYELYKYRFDNGENTPISSLDNKLWEDVQVTFSSLLDIFTKDKNDITIKDIVEILIWEGSKNPKTQLKYSIKNNKMVVFDKSFTKEEFEKEENKNLFIYTLTENKRHQIKFRKKLSDNNNLNIENSRAYLEYLISNNILNTNAKINEPTFQGKTTMYLAKDKVKIKGKPSEFNKDIKKVFKNKVIGNNKTLKQALPKLFNKTFTLSGDESLYIDEIGNKYKRATSLKDKPYAADGLRMINSAARGDIIDELTRIYFSTNITSDEFLKRGKIILNDVNTSKNSNIVISDRFFNSLYDILEDYKVLFDELDYTIYSNTPSIGGVIGNKGNIAGTIDLLAYNNKSKKWVLIDLKTSTTDRTEEYSKETDPSYIKKKGYSYKNQDTIQLNTYKELFKQTTGIEVEGLQILPLTSKSENIGSVNSTFDEINKPSGELLLNIDSSKDIYNILNISKKQLEEDPGTEEEQAAMVEGVSAVDKLLGMMGETVKNKPIKAPTKKEVKSLSEDKIKENTVNAYKKGSYFHYPVGTKTYWITYDFYVIDSTENKVITDKNTILRIIKNYNKVAVPSAVLNYDKAVEEWNNRIPYIEKEAVSELKEKEAVQQVEMMEVYDKNAVEIFKNLTKNFRIYIKEFQPLIKKESTYKGKVNAIVKFLKSKGISQEQIKTKCGL